MKIWTRWQYARDFRSTKVISVTLLYSAGISGLSRTIMTFHSFHYFPISLSLHYLYFFRRAHVFNPGCHSCFLLFDARSYKIMLQNQMYTCAAIQFPVF